MWRNRTVRELIRSHEKREARLLQMVTELQDRLMQLSGSPWALPPATPPVADEEDPYEAYVQPDQQLGDSVLY